MVLDHINIKAPADLLAQEKDFWCDVIGLHLGERAQLNDKGYWLYNEHNQAIVHLSVADERVDAQGYFDHIALKTSGLAHYTALLEAQSIQYQQRVLADKDITQVFVRSPLGIRIELSFQKG